MLSEVNEATELGLAVEPAAESPRFTARGSVLDEAEMGDVDVERWGGTQQLQTSVSGCKNLCRAVLAAAHMAWHGTQSTSTYTHDMAWHT
jgi:hypothetical protein